MQTALNDDALNKLNKNILDIEQILNEPIQNLKITNLSGGAAKCRLVVKCDTKDKTPSLTDYEEFWENHLEEQKKREKIKELQISLLKITIKDLENLKEKYSKFDNITSNIKKDIESINQKILAL